MRATLLAAAVVVAAALCAAPAHADEGLYLKVLQQQMAYNYNKYGSDVLLGEGYKVCDAVAQGYDWGSVVAMIQSDLAVSSYSAGTVYGAATSGLGC